MVALLSRRISLCPAGTGNSWQGIFTDSWFKLKAKGNSISIYCKTEEHWSERDAKGYIR